MSLTKEQAERIAEEALAQGWEADRDMHPYEQDGEQREMNWGHGHVTVHQHYTSGGWKWTNPSDHHDWSGRGNNDKVTCATCGTYRWDHDGRTNAEERCRGEKEWIKSVPLDTYSVELCWPAYSWPKYWVSDTEEWRKLKSKIDELKQIVQEITERGWEIKFPRVTKAGKWGMTLDNVYPPGYRSPVRIGGMRTWRKLCREADSILEQRKAPEALEQG